MDRLGKKIKELRKKTDLTQEQLAERLGVSFQAVSKWETGTALPDISMLPVLANFFNVTTDELLGVDLSKKQEKIDEILSEYTRLKNLGKENKSFDFIRKAYYEYPNDYRIMEKYIFGLYYNAPNNFDENGNYVPLANEDELFYLCNRILDECPLDSVHYSALSMLSSLYSDKGDTEKALEYNNRFPTYGYSQEEELEEIYDRGSDKWFEVVPSNINQLTYMLVIKIRNIALYTSSPPDEQINIFEKAVDLLRLIYDQSDYGFNHYHLCELYIYIANRYIMLKDYVNAAKYLDLGLFHGKMYDELPTKTVHVSILVKDHVFDKSTVYSGYEGNEIKRVPDYIDTNKFYDEVRNMDWFKAVLDKYRPFAKDTKY
jgi:transcriptional regulator with XRE-family HTH domain